MVLLVSCVHSVIIVHLVQPSQCYVRVALTTRTEGQGEKRSVRRIKMGKFYKHFLYKQAF